MESASVKSSGLGWWEVWRSIRLATCKALSFA